MSNAISPSITEEYISAILGKIAILHNLKEWRHSVEKFESIAQNYFGLLIPVVLTGTRGGNSVVLRLVLKLAPTDERYRVSGAITVMFNREIYVYTVILKKYQEIQESLTDYSKYVIPRCHYVQKEFCKEVLALQDMREEGFQPYTHEMFLDLDHIIVSLKALAKLHALSFILSHKDLELYNEISKTCIPLSENTNKRYMDIMRDRLDKAVKKFENTQYIPLLTDLTHNCAKYFLSAIESVEVTCICHGDIWKENILYKYKDKKPISACLIDYQTTRISSPAFDTLYLILTSTNTNLRHKYYTQLLDIYYQTFDKLLNKVGLQSHIVYPQQMFVRDLAIVAPACLITANTALWLSSGLQEEGHVRSKQILTTQEDKDMAVNKYKEIVMQIINDLISYGYISLPKVELC